MNKNLSIVNKKALFNYYILEKFEAGIALTGPEIKSARAGSASLVDGYARISNNTVLLTNVYIAPYKKSRDNPTDSRRERLLLLNKREIDYIRGKTEGSNLTIVPLKLYFKAGFAKIELGLALGKKKADKREVLRKKAIQRETEKILREEKLKYQKESRT